MTGSKDTFVSRCFSTEPGCVSHLQPGSQADGWQGLLLADDWLAARSADSFGAGIVLPDPGDNGGRLLVCGALEHWRTQWLAATAARRGACVGVLDPFCPATLLAVIDELEIGAVQVQPWHLQKVLQLAESAREAFSGDSVEQVCMGGARCPAWVRSDIERWWQVSVQEHYSRRDFPVVVALGHPENLAIVDAGGELAATGHIGRVGFVGASNLSVLPLPGSVPDWGVIDNSQQLELLGREDTLLELPAGKVSPIEAERVLETHPAVAAARLVRMADGGAGFMAAVELRPAAAGSEPVWVPSPLLELALLDLCADSLSSIKCPLGVAFVDCLPRRVGGRVDDDRLRSVIR